LASYGTPKRRTRHHIVKHVMQRENEPIKRVKDELQPLMHHARGISERLRQHGRLTGCRDDRPRPPTIFSRVRFSVVVCLCAIIPSRIHRQRTNITDGATIPHEMNLAQGNATQYSRGSPRRPPSATAGRTRCSRRGSSRTSLFSLRVRL